MPNSKKGANQIGWMYHAPANRENAEPVDYPHASQIPGLGTGPPTQEELNELEKRKVTVINENDSQYIQLAKQGGHPNLLYIKENKRNDRPPKDYPKCDWFYLEDNRIEDDENKKNESHKFYVPDYMCHGPMAEDESQQILDNYRPSRIPYALDAANVLVDEPGRKATDKTVKLQEARPAGYGIRLEKQKGTPSKPGNVPPTTSSAGRRRRPPTQDKVHMGKLLAGGYEGEQPPSPRSKKGGKKPEPMVTSYMEAFSPEKPKPKHGRRAGPKSDKDLTDAELKAKDAHLQKEIDALEQELFKMKRFKDIPAKVDSHRRSPNKSSGDQLIVSGREEGYAY